MQTTRNQRKHVTLKLKKWQRKRRLLLSRFFHGHVHTPITFLKSKTKTMENGIIRIPQLPINEIMSIGKAFAESGMFPDTRQAAQAIVKIQAGQEIGIPPFAAMTGIHIIQGKPTIGAGIIAAKIKASGKYDYKVIEQNDTVCSIDFYQGKEKLGNSVFNISDAKKAETKNISKFPRNMLFARAISNGVKWFCPDVFMGPVYTPEDFEEQQQQTVDGTAEIIPPTQPMQLVPPNNEYKETERQQAITEMATSENMEQLKECWTKWKRFQKDPDFMAKKEEMKNKISQLKVA